MPAYIHRIETRVPEQSYDQHYISELMHEHVGQKNGIRRIIRSVYQHSGIEKRHSVIRDFDPGNTDVLFFSPQGKRLPSPDTRTRNHWYTRESRKLFSQLASDLLSDHPDFSAQDITHVITVSCTGFFAPGPDYYIVIDTGMREEVQRFHIGFMGCHAAFQGLKMARSFCENDPDAVVMVISVELCTLHLRFEADTDSIISGSVFADGGAAALVSSRKPSYTPSPKSESGRERYLEPISFHNALASEGESDMAWTIGNHGFEMKLSTYVPDIIHRNIRPLLERILACSGLGQSQISQWAIHPGGRAILDKVEHALCLPDESLRASRNTLLRYGNMSSATILFVLKELLDLTAATVTSESDNKKGENVFALGFGPGLTIESALFRLHPL